MIRYWFARGPVPVPPVPILIGSGFRFLVRFLCFLIVFTKRKKSSVVSKHRSKFDSKKVWAALGAYQGVFVVSWDVLGVSCGVLGRLGMRHGRVLGSLGDVLGEFQAAP